MAPRGGRTHNGTIVRGAEEAANTGYSPLCGLCHFRPLRLEGFESKQIQKLHPDGERLHHQGSARSIGLHTVEGLLPDSTHDAHHAGCGDVGSPPQLRSSCGEAHTNISHGMAPRIQCRRAGKVEPFKQVEIAAPHGPEGWKVGPKKLGPCQTMGLGLSTTGPGRRLLADAGGWASPHMAGSRESGYSQDPIGAACDELHGRGPQGNHSSSGHEETAFEVHFKDVAKEEKKEQTNRRPRLPRAKRLRRRRRKERKEGQRKGRHKTKVLQLEQWHTALRRIITGANVCRKSPALASLHGLQFTRPPIQVLPKSNAGVNNHGEGHDGEGQKKEETSGSKGGDSDYTYTYETEEEDDQKDEKQGDEEDKDKKRKDEEGGENNEEPIDADSLDDYFRRRTFIFVHHFAGPEDPLTEAMLVEASKRKVLLKTISVEKDKGTGDLLKDEPYGTHLRWAKRGYIDAFHSGFPCATFSRLKFREVEGLPGPIRTKEEPYGRKSNTGREQQSCDDGTIMACRSINIANAVADKKTETKVRPIATLENPPESDHPQHLSAWELPEMKEFTKRSGRRVALFNTCAYQNQTPIGNRHFKPQKFVGTLMGIEQLCKRCGCGGFATHDAIIGPQKSKESGRYPDEFCEAYAKLAIQHLILMGKEEYLKERMTKLGDTIGKRKAEVVEYNTLRRPSRSPVTRRRREAEEERAKREVDVDHSSSPARPAGHNSPPPTRPRSRSPRNKRVELKPNQNKGWIEGEGKYGSLKAQKSKAEMRDPAEFVGGMRNPYETVVAMSNLLSLGIRVRAAWEAFCRQNKGAMTVAEQYGTKECWMDNKLLQNWKGHLKKVLGANAPPAVKMTPRWGYVSPLDPEIFEAWVTRGNDPEVHVSDWIRRGAPLGIESPIPTAGIFPPAEANNMDYPGQQELEDAAGQLSKGHLTNYSSVQENMEEAKVELDRYRKAGFMVDVKKEVVTKEMKHGTISKLGLIIKHKPEGIKRRIILDLRRSGGNKKATLPEKLVLPRPRDFLNSIRSVYAMQRAHGRDEGYARELAVIDVSDAFMSLAVDERELPHTLAPNIESEDFYMFVALLFGYKTAPLLWSRVAALLSRLIQSAVPGSVGQHQTYLDDAAWVLQGSLAERNETLAFILYTMAALGFRISLQKGMRSTQVTWVGVRFTVTPDHVIIGLPEKFVTELVELLESWHNKGMVAIKELRQAAGRVSWMSGILPRTRWVVATFYKVLHERLNDVATGAEAIRRSNRQDTRPKDHLFGGQAIGTTETMVGDLLEGCAVEADAQIQAGHREIPEGHHSDGCQSTWTGSHPPCQQQSDESPGLQGDGYGCPPARLQGLLERGRLPRHR